MLLLAAFSSLPALGAQQLPTPTDDPFLLDSEPGKLQVDPLQRVRALPQLDPSPRLGASPQLDPSPRLEASAQLDPSTRLGASAQLDPSPRFEVLAQLDPLLLPVDAPPRVDSLPRAQSQRLANSQLLAESQHAQSQPLPPPPDRARGESPQATVESNSPVPMRRLTPAEISALAAATPAGRSGVQMTALIGDPTKPGLYTVRVSIPPHTQVPAHTHRDNRAVTVMSGTWRMGYGTHFDANELKDLPPGSFYTEPAGQPHFSQTGDDPVVIWVTGYGPSDTKMMTP